MTLNMRAVTTSWDDGDPSDFKIADLLRSRKLPGTFYVPITGYQGRRTVSANDLRELCSKGFEIGGHSVSHVSLSNLSRKKVKYEVRDCKQMLEQTLGEKVLVFCYPNGRFDADVVREVYAAGYRGARTTRMLSLNTQFLPFEMPTTLQAYPHPVTSYLRNLGRARNIQGLWTYAMRLKKIRSWVDLGKQLFDEVLQYGGIWHLYGHSWEIEELAIWGQLRELLDYVCKREGVLYPTNGQLLSMTNGQESIRPNEKLV
jgi:peptidoglycan/xylan/chitin deacetylase (PgdA/CDA1 family)